MTCHINTDKMTTILIIGSGGREHVLGCKFSQSDEISAVFYAPGNKRHLRISGLSRKN